VVVLDRDELLGRVARGLTTAADADALRPILFGRRGKGHAKLTPAAVREMRTVWRRWRHAGAASRRGGDHKGYSALGRLFAISAATARDVVRGRTWRDAGGPIDCVPSQGAQR
jgi:hypothetical protein